jgi:hypothetical protein
MGKCVFDQGNVDVQARRAGGFDITAKCQIIDQETYTRRNLVLTDVQFPRGIGRCGNHICSELASQLPMRVRSLFCRWTNLQFKWYL